MTADSPAALAVHAIPGRPIAVPTGLRLVSGLTDDQRGSTIASCSFNGTAGIVKSFENACGAVERRLTSGPLLFNNDCYVNEGIQLRRSLRCRCSVELRVSRQGACLSWMVSV